MDFKKIKEQIRWIRKQYSDMLNEQKAQKQQEKADKQKETPRKG